MHMGVDKRNVRMGVDKRNVFASILNIFRGLYIASKYPKNYFEGGGG